MKVGIVGFGPIGQYHLRMCADVLGDTLEEVRLYDLKSIAKEVIPSVVVEKVTLVESWQDAYTEADVFITCTVSKTPYIDQQPKPGSLHLNVSLRDYKTTVFPWFEKGIIVDDWNLTRMTTTRTMTWLHLKSIKQGRQQKTTDTSLHSSETSSVYTLPLLSLLILNHGEG